VDRFLRPHLRLFARSPPLCPRRAYKTMKTPVLAKQVLAGNDVELQTKSFYTRKRSKHEEGGVKLRRPAFTCARASEMSLILSLSVRIGSPMQKRYLPLQRSPRICRLWVEMGDNLIERRGPSGHNEASLTPSAIFRSWVEVGKLGLGPLTVSLYCDTCWRDANLYP